MEFLHNLLDLYVDMSFYIVIGLLFTGLLHLFVKREWIAKQVGKRGLGSTVKAAILGVPLPLCSCGVVPTAIYLGENGASRGAVTSFLTSTPQTGVDSILATYGMMGPLFAIFRPFAAFCSGIITGVLTDTFVKDAVPKVAGQPTSCCCGGETPKVEEAHCCCSSEAPKAEEPHCCCSSETPKVEEPHCCCSSETPKVEASCCCGTKPQSPSKWKEFVSFTFGDFLDEITVNFLVGLVIAALITTLIPTDFLATFTSPFTGMLLMLVVGIPMYVCSTASIPIAMSLILKGISPGAAFVFLFAGPVTNIASLAMLTKTLGKKTMGIYLSSVALCALGFGLVLDSIVAQVPGGITAAIASPHSHGTPVYMLVVAALFALALAKSLYRKFGKSN